MCLEVNRRTYTQSVTMIKKKSCNFEREKAKYIWEVK